MTILTSDAAHDDLDRIWLDSARRYGIEQADRLIGRLDAVFLLLERFPQIGLKQPKLSSDVRLFPVQGYPFIVFFKPISDGIRIVRILHERMRPTGRK